MTFLVTMLVTDAGFELIDAGLLLAAVHAAGVFARLGWGWVADLVGGATGILTIMGILSTVICLIVTQLTPEWPLYLTYLLCIVFSITAIGWNGIYYAEIASKCKADEVGSITGGSLAFVFGGVSFGPAIFATVYFWIGSYTLTFGLVSLAAATAVVFMFMARKSDTTLNVSKI